MKNNKWGGVIVALLGPDGSGKTTLCADLLLELEKNSIDTIGIYGSKKKDQFFKLTNLSYEFYGRLQRLKFKNKMVGGKISSIYMIFVHFPLEFIDNLFLYNNSRKYSNSGYVVVFDRYPIDRILPLTQSYLDYNFNGRAKRKMVTIILRFYGFLYWCFFPLPDMTFFLDTDEYTLIQRRGDCYKNGNEAENARATYHELYDMINRKNKDVYLLEPLNIDAVIKIILGRRRKNED
jgi:thymidylate kinase